MKRRCERAVGKPPTAFIIAISPQWPVKPDGLHCVIFSVILGLGIGEVLFAMSGSLQTPAFKTHRFFPS